MHQFRFLVSVCPFVCSFACLFARLCLRWSLTVTLYQRNWTQVRFIATLQGDAKRMAPLTCQQIVMNRGKACHCCQAKVSNKHYNIITWY